MAGKGGGPRRALLSRVLAVTQRADDDRGVVAAEAEAVAHGGRELPLAGVVRRVVEIAHRDRALSRLIVGGIDAVAQRQHGQHQLDAAAGAQQVAELALGARDAQLVGVLAEDRLDGGRLGLVAQRRARAVGVDVVDRRRVELARRRRARSSPGRRRCRASSGWVMWPASALAP